MYANRKNNDMAVSPIVATLVLIVVAVIGAVAVGTIMGTFSTDVSKQASSQNAAGAAQSEILVAGSTTVDPVTQALGKIYTAANPGIKITSQATGSGAGFQAVTAGIADIGAMSEAPSVTQMTQNPSIQKYRIGSGIVAIITNKSVADTVFDVDDIYTLYNTGIGATTTANMNAISRSDSSGTADTFAKWLGMSGQSAISGNVKKVSGNANVVAEVAKTENGFGFADYGYAAKPDSGVKIQAYDDNIQTYGTGTSQGAFTYSNLTKTVKFQWQSTEEQNPDGTYVKDGSQYNGAISGKGSTKDSRYYNLSLVHPLYYLTNGNPATVQKDYIEFARSASGTQAFVATNTWGATTLL